MAALLLLVGCTTTSEPDASPAPASSASPSTPDLGAAVSRPREDSVYPQVGDPGVDALHYDLHLDWEPDTRTLDATETLRLRATADARRLQLDLAAPLEVTRLTVDGSPARFDHVGKDLVVHHQVRAGERYALAVRYSGTPRPVPAPSTRGDFDSTGWTTTAGGEVWTMQEPYGAFSWYAVNDHPSDKALYSFTIRAPAPWVGVANGRLVSREERDGETVSQWQLDEPAASYLVTVAIGDLTRTEDQSGTDVPITYWTPSDQPEILDRLLAAPAALAWLEERLGPFPFDTLGFLVVDSRSGMETQTMITLGDTDYATSPEVLVHEIAHQWYGDQVTPEDWRDVWMNEGMAMYLQGVWTAENTGRPLDSLIDDWARIEEQLRAQYGPPADYDPRSFGAPNIYICPAVMWDELRKRIGDEEFWALVREWPTVHDNGNAGYDEITSWWSEQTGEDLSEFFDAWLLSPTSPERG